MPMTLTSLADLRTNEVLAGEFLKLLADRNALPNHPALKYVGSITGSPSNVIQVSHIGLDGVDIMAATAETGTTPDTDFTDDSTDVTVARQSLARSFSDLARYTDAHGVLRPEVLAQDAYYAYVGRLVEMVAALVGTFTDTEGTSGVDASYENFLSARAKLRGRSAGGPLLFVGHDITWTQILHDIRLNAGGSVQMDPASHELMKTMGPGYQGRWDGVDVFTSNRVPTTNGGADYAGGMFAPGGIVWGDADPEPDGIEQAVIGGKVLFERDRNATDAITRYVSHAYLGASLAIDDAGTSFITGV